MYHNGGCPARSSPYTTPTRIPASFYVQGGYNGTILSHMPRIARARISLLDSSMVRFIGATIGIAGILSLGALFLGFSDTGAIDVNGRISSTDQTNFATKVNTSVATDEVNGGLRPAGEDSTNAPDAPTAPVVSPEVSGASTTEATTTDATTTEDTSTSTDSTPE